MAMNTKVNFVFSYINFLSTLTRLKKKKNLRKQIFVTAVYVVLMVANSSGQYGNRYVQRGFAQEFGQDVLDQGKYPSQIHAYIQNSGQGHNNLGWNGYQVAASTFNPYHKLGYGYLPNQGINGGLAYTDGGQLFGVPQPVNFIGNQRIRI